MIWNKNTLHSSPLLKQRTNFPPWTSVFWWKLWLLNENAIITLLPTFAETDKCLQGGKVDVQQNSLMPFSWNWVGKISCRHQPFFTLGHICWNGEASWQIVCGEKSWQLTTKFTIAVVKKTLQTFNNSHCKKVWPKQIIIHS